MADGRCPFQEWFVGLRDLKAAARIEARLTRMETGNLGDCKSGGDGVYELRIDHGPGYRVYFAESGRTVVVLLCGGDKATQERDIRRARTMWKDHGDDPERLQRNLRA